MQRWGENRLSGFLKGGAYYVDMFTGCTAVGSASSPFWSMSSPGGLLCMRASEAPNRNLVALAV